MAGREEMEQRWKEIEARFSDGQIPLPDSWGGYRLYPLSIEFWQGRPSRMHDRILYTRMASHWNMARLGP
jgi:pyridoxamine 5'-phosphate oxidase